MKEKTFKRRLKRKQFSVVIVLTLILSMMPYETLVVHAEEPTHTHEWVYTANDNTLTAECKSTTGTCGLPNRKLSLTLSATDGNFSGRAATISVGTDAEKSAWSAAGLMVPTSISYENAAGSTLSEAPTTAGEYVAKVSPVGEDPSAANTAELYFYINSCLDIPFDGNGKHEIGDLNDFSESYNWNVNIDLAAGLPINRIIRQYYGADGGLFFRENFEVDTNNPASWKVKVKVNGVDTDIYALYAIYSPETNSVLLQEVTPLVPVENIISLDVQYKDGDIIINQRYSNSYNIHTISIGEGESKTFTVNTIPGNLYDPFYISYSGTFAESEGLKAISKVIRSDGSVEDYFTQEGNLWHVMNDVDRPYELFTWEIYFHPVFVNYREEYIREDGSPITEPAKSVTISCKNNIIEILYDWRRGPEEAPPESSYIPFYWDSSSYSSDMPSSNDESYSVPLSGRNTVQIEASISDGNATIKEISANTISNLGDNDSITIDVSNASSKVNAVILSKQTFDVLASAIKDTNNKINTLEIKYSNVILEIDKKAMNAIQSQAKGNNIKLSVDTKNSVSKLNTAQQNALKKKNVSAVFSAVIESNGTKIHNFNGGSISVTVAFKPAAGTDPNYYHVEYVSDTGEIERFATKMTMDGIEFVVPHFSDYVIVYDTTKANNTGITTSPKTGESQFSWVF